MRLIAFSDLHSDEWEDFSYSLPNGINSRLADCVNVLSKVNYYRDKYDCNLVLFGGDMFHLPLVMPTVVFQETYRAFEELAKRSIPPGIIINAGNHDMASITKDGRPVSTVYATRNLSNTNIAVGAYKRIFLPRSKMWVHCVPYIKDPVLLDAAVDQVGSRIHDDPKSAHIVLTHFGLDEATNGPNEIKLRGYPAKKLRKLGADKIFAGHHHHPQSLGSIEVIGTPIQHNMLDRGDKRGLVIYDTKTKVTTRVWLKSSRFFLYEIKSQKDFDRLKREQEQFQGGYVRVLLTQGVVSESKVSDIVAASARTYKILPIRELKSGMRSEAVTQKAVANIGNISVVVEDYVEHVSPEHLKKKRLISIGKKLLKEQL